MPDGDVIIGGVIVDLVLPGRPVPQGSKVRTRYGMRESNENLAPWRDSMVAAVRRNLDDTKTATYTGPVRVELDFAYGRPRSHYGTGRNADTLKPSAPGEWHGSKPDVDKLARAVLDALVIAGAIRDDSLVARLYAEKRWAPTPYLSVLVSVLA